MLIRLLQRLTVRLVLASACTCLGSKRGALACRRHFFLHNLVGLILRGRQAAYLSSLAPSTIRKVRKVRLDFISIPFVASISANERILSPIRRMRRLKFNAFKCPDSCVSVIFYTIITINTTLRHLPDVPEGSYTCLAVGFAAGPSADAVSALKPEEALKRALQQLDDMFRGREWLQGANGCTGKGDWEDQTTADKLQPQKEAVMSMDKTSNMPNFESSALPSSSFVDGLVHDWADEPFVRGGYSYPRVDFDENTPADAAAVVGGVLFFAGEHTNTPTGMTAHAAVDSGKRCGDRTPVQFLFFISGIFVSIFLHNRRAKTIITIITVLVPYYK